jgi:hypothetical protein
MWIQGYSPAGSWIRFCLRIGVCTTTVRSNAVAIYGAVPSVLRECYGTDYGHIPWRIAWWGRMGNSSATAQCIKQTGEVE